MSHVSHVFSYSSSSKFEVLISILSELLDHTSELSVVMKMSHISLSNMVDTSHMLWLTSVTGEINLKFYLFLINLNGNANSHRWQVASALHSTGLDIQAV